MNHSCTEKAREIGYGFLQKPILRNCQLNWLGEPHLFAYWSIHANSCFCQIEGNVLFVFFQQAESLPTFVIGDVAKGLLNLRL